MGKKIKLKCPREGCGYEWSYKGSNPWVTSCPKCHTTLSVPRAAERYLRVMARRDAEKRRRKNA